MLVACIARVPRSRAVGARHATARRVARSGLVHSATFVPGMELGNISPNGGEGMSGLRGGFGLTGCCQVCPEEFYKELNFLELGDAHKLSVMNKFHGQFGLPAIPDKHARRALDAAAKRAASAVARSRKPHGRSSSLIETSSSLRQQGFMGAMAGALAGGSMPGFARMKTGASKAITPERVRIAQAMFPSSQQISKPSVRTV